MGLGSGRLAHRRRRPNVLVLFVAGLGLFAFLPLLTGLAAGLVLLSLKVLLFIQIIVALFRMLCFFTRFGSRL